jgi:apolipoprotein N-acyltransferase
MVFEQDGRLQSIYDKIHLVPFGEYLPFQTAFESIGLEQLTRWRGGFSVGATPRPLLSIVGLPPTAGLICYEAIFPGAVIQGDQRPGLLINVTNDGWFGNTTGPSQHFHQARVRAVEEGLPLIRAANNGISAVVDGRGRIVAKLDLNERNVIDSEIPSIVKFP